LLTVLCLRAAASAGPYEKVSRDLSRSAERDGKRRIAVLPFSSIDGQDPKGGLALAERLVTAFLEEGRLQVVERTLLETVLKEQGLEHKGLVDRLDAPRLGRVLGVEAVVTGTFLCLPGDRIEVNARLLDAETARVLGAATVRVPREWRESSPDSVDFPVPEPPDIGGFAEPWPARAELRDSVSGSVCTGWEERVDRIQEASMELKARHWAARLREPGFSAVRLRRNPGSEIRSQLSRQEFYRRIKELYGSGEAVALDASEAGRVERSDLASRLLAERCDR